MELRHQLLGNESIVIIVHLIEERFGIHLVATKSITGMFFTARQIRQSQRCVDFVRSISYNYDRCCCCC